MSNLKYIAAAALVAFASACGGATDSDPDDTGQFVEVTEDITADTTWEAGTYGLSGDFRVEAQLTIEPCTTIEVDSRIFVQNGGSIVAIGTEECPIRFTSSKGTPAAGDWTRLQIEDTADNSNEFEHVIFEYGGDEHGIVFLYGSASFRNTTVRHTPSIGMKLFDGRVLEFSDMTFENILGHPFSIAPNDVDVIDGVTTMEVQDDKIRVENERMTEAGTWQPQSIPYQMIGDVRIEARLELAPGTTLQMTPDSRGFVTEGGSIHAMGTQDAPVIIESANSTPLAGDWKQFTLEAEADGSSFEYTTIRHGGASGHGVFVPYGNLTLDNVTFEDNQDCDIRSAENVTATATDFVECS